MPNDTITLVLDGVVFYEDFRTVVDAWMEMLGGFKAEISGSDRVDWAIDYLAAGSFTGSLKSRLSCASNDIE